nr:2-hydroxyacyl-CoA dehydratase family protein [Candidatus Sigynarchaeota archaeon]
MSSMLKSYFEDLEKGLSKKLAEKVTARRTFIHEIARIGMKMFDPAWSTAWTTVFVPFEILNAMGVSGLFIEFVGAMVAGAGVARPFFERAEREGYSTDGCSYHRTIVGAALNGMLPEPDLLIAASFPCNGGVKALMRIGEIYKKDVLILNSPYRDTPESIDYLVKQYENMIAFIKEKNGRELDVSKLKQSIHYNNEGREYLLEAFELCKHVPSPANSDDWKNFVIYALLSGSKEGVAVAKTYRDELKRRLDAGVVGVPGEKHRLLWVQNRLQFKTDLIDVLEKQYKANVVIDELNYVYWTPMDEADPLRSLATRQIRHPLIGPVERRLHYLTQMAGEFKVDGVINPSHWGCRQSAGVRGLFKDAFQAIGIPLIHLDVDCVDERNYARGQLLTRLEAFMELLG